MRALLDVNVLVALADPDHAFHDRAHTWLQSGRPVATCPLTENGLVRVISNPNYSKTMQFHPKQIVDILAAFAARQDHEFWPDDISMRDPAVVDPTRILGARQVTDIYLLALAVAHHGCLATFGETVNRAAVPKARPDHLCVI